MKWHVEYVVFLCWHIQVKVLWAIDKLSVLWLLSSYGLFDYIALYLALEIILGPDSNDWNTKTDSDRLSEDERRVVPLKQMIKQVLVTHVGFHHCFTHFQEDESCFTEKAIS